MGEVPENGHTPLQGRPGNRIGWRGARGRGGTFPAHSGCAGAPPGTTRGPREELADGGPFTACLKARRPRPGVNTHEARPSGPKAGPSGP